MARMRSGNCKLEYRGRSFRSERHKPFSAYEMELQISHRVCAEVSAQSILWRKRREIGKILRKLCEWKKVRIVEAEVCPDHVHMLLEIPPRIAVSSFVGYWKGKSSLMIYEQYPNRKYKYRNREFWWRGYYVDTAGKNAKKREEYICELPVTGLCRCQTLPTPHEAWLAT